MIHTQLDQWSRGSSWLHRRDPRAKLAATLFFLLALTTATSTNPTALIGFALISLFAAVVARLPILGVLVRSGAVLPFGAMFALVTYLSGDPKRAWELLTKTWLSAMAVIVLVATTPLPQIVRGLEGLAVPRMLLLTISFLYRYLFVLIEQAERMRYSALCRDPGRKWVNKDSLFRSASGAVSVLFARSYSTAQGIHQAMIARGFNTTFPSLTPLAFNFEDVLYLVFKISTVLIVRYAATS